MEAEIDKLVDALVDIYEVIKDFSREDQKRILAASSRLIGNRYEGKQVPDSSSGNVKITRSEGP